MTISISSAPSSTAFVVSNALTSDLFAPRGKPTTVTILTSVPYKFSLASFT